MNKKLYQRVYDIYTGAIGHPFVEEKDFLGATELANVITALASVFDPDDKETKRFALWNISEFENPTKATKHIEYIINVLKNS
jgi:hypothetical protein